MTVEVRRAVTTALCCGLVSIGLGLLGGCMGGASDEGTRPVPLVTNQPRPDPFVYGDGERLLVFAAVGGNVLYVNRTTGPIVDFLGHRLGVRFRLSYYRRYPDIVEAVADGTADFAWLGPTTYLAVRKKVPCVPVAQILRDGVSYYEGVILVRSEDQAATVQDLKGRNFAFIDRNSTSGFLYPMAFLRRQGIEPKNFFGSVDFAGGHSDAVLRLISNQYDAVCSERDVVTRLSYKIDKSRVRVLAVTGRIPNGPIAVHPKHSAEFIERARRMLTTMTTDPDGSKLLVELQERWNLSGFGPVADHVYDDVERVMADAERDEP